MKRYQELERNISFYGKDQEFEKKDHFFMKKDQEFEN